ncbi:MAG TPA: hypothetical protein VEK11_02795 [Thermoanaerobaculia bacterium]|nr:hypothetical protein [Thermoanaerobaculia bacterium]
MIRSCPRLVFVVVVLSVFAVPAFAPYSGKECVSGCFGRGAGVQCYYLEVYG